MPKCDWHDHTKRRSEPGARCYQPATYRVERRMPDPEDDHPHVFVSYRCAFHVPPTLTRLGRVTVERLQPAPEPISRHREGSESL